MKVPIPRRNLWWWMLAVALVALDLAVGNVSARRWDRVRPRPKVRARPSKGCIGIGNARGTSYLYPDGSIWYVTGSIARDDPYPTRPRTRRLIRGPTPLPPPVPAPAPKPSMVLWAWWPVVASSLASILVLALASRRVRFHSAAARET